MSDDPKIGDGDVRIILAGSEEILRPTWEAAFQLSRMTGGLLSLQTSCRQGDLESISMVIGLGLGRKLGDDLRKTVYETGIWGLSLQCQTFLAILSNGGKPLPSVEDEKKKGDPQL